MKIKTYYTLLAFFVFSIISASFASAYLTIDNYKQFHHPSDENGRYGTIEVWEGNFFTPNVLTAIHTLDDNTDLCITSCYAKGRTNLIVEQALFNDVQFYNGQVTDQRMWLVDNETTIQVPDYETICETAHAPNGTDYDHCTTTQTGTHESVIKNYRPYNNEILPVGVYEWKIEGNKDRDAHVEWIAKSNGVDLTEWASWNSSFTNGLVAYYKMDSVINTNITEVYRGQYNLSILDSTQTITAGFIADASKTTTPSGVSRWNTTYAPPASVAGITLNWWMNATSYSNVQTTQLGNCNVGGGTGANGGFRTYPSASTMVANSQDSVGQKTIQMTQTPVTHRWNMVTLIVNATGVMWHLNGTSAGYIAQSSFAFTGNTPLDLFQRIEGGCGATGDTYTFDEYGVWNRTLSSSEITDLYNGGIGMTFSPEPTQINVNVTLSIPANNTNFTQFQINFTANATALNSNLTNMTLYVWNSTSSEMVSNLTNVVSQNASINWTQTLPRDDTYRWNVFACNNFSGNCTFAPLGNRTFTIDTTPPVVNITAPNGQTTYDNRNVTLNFTRTDLNGFTNCWYSLNNGTNITLSGCNNNSIILNARNNSIRVYANDSLGNVGSSTVYPYYFPILQICNATTPLRFVNFTFQNETTLLESVTASITSTWTYWFDQTINRSLSYTNATENPSYAFCIDGGKETLNANPSINYYNTYSPQRTYASSLSLTNATSNITLFLLPTSAGLDVSFQVVTVSGSPIASATVNATRSGNLIESKLTDGAGIATMFLNPNQEYTICAAKVENGQVCSAITPTQTQYTFTLGSGGGGAPIDYTRGVTYLIRPLESFLINNTVYNFNFTIASPSLNLDSWGFQLYDSAGNLINSTSIVSNSGTLNLFADTRSNQSIRMNAYWVVNATSQNVTKYWVIYNNADSYSIFNFFKRLDSYTNGTDSDGLFGLQRTGNMNFGYSLLIFLIIFCSAGILSYKYGLTSPAAIMVVIFGTVFFFDITLGILPRPSAISNIPAATIITAIIMITFLIKEAQQ